MITPQFMYFITLLDGIVGFFVAGFCVFFIIALVAFLKSIDDYTGEQTQEDAKKYIKPSIILMIVFLLLAVFIPNTKQAAMIYVIPKILNNEKVNEMPDIFIDLAKEYLKNKLSNNKE